MSNHYLGPPPMNPLSRLLAGIVGALALIGAIFFGAFIFIFVVAVGLIAWFLIWLRMWWLRRKMAASGFPPGPGPGPVQHGPPGGAEKKGDVLEAEYEVVSRREDD